LKASDESKSCGMMCNWHVWNYCYLFFEDDAGRAVTVNADR
jgi:hypothetical protein